MFPSAHGTNLCKFVQGLLGIRFACASNCVMLCVCMYVCVYVCMYLCMHAGSCVNVCESEVVRGLHYPNQTNLVLL
jgi:hypothetical protein